MQVRLSEEEAWSAMTLIVSQVLDNVELSETGVVAVKKWRSDHDRRSAPMKELTAVINDLIESTSESR